MNPEFTREVGDLVSAMGDPRKAAELHRRNFVRAAGGEANGLYRRSLPNSRPSSPMMYSGPGTITDDKWQSWYDSLATDSEDSKLHAQFVSEVDRTLNEPVIQLGLGRPFTPNEFIEYALSEDPDLKALGNEELRQVIQQNVRANIAGLPGAENQFGIGPQSKVVQDVVDQTIEAMRGSGAPVMGREGSESEFAPVEESQYQRWQKESGPMEARYRVTDAGQRNLDATRAANLFRTFQSGGHAPEFAGNISATALGAAGAAAAGIERAWRLDPENKPDTLDVMAMGGRSLDATPAGRLRESMYWHGQGKPPVLEQDQKYKDSWQGAKYPQFSSTTFSGVGTNLSSNENAASLVNLPFRTFFQQPIETTAAERDQINQASRSLVRTTPVVSDGADIRAAKDMQKTLMDRASENEGWLSAQYPRAANAVNSLAGQKVMEPEYLSRAADTVGNMPRWYVEDPTAAFLAGKGAISAAKGYMAGGARGAAKGFGQFLAGTGDDFLKELPQETGADAAINPSFSNPFEAQKTNSWMVTKTGESISADDPEYEKKYQDVFARRKENLDRMKSQAPSVLPRQGFF